jgi:flagellar motor switch protein FliN/FliY
VEAAEPARAPEAAAPAPLPLPSPQESKVNLDRLLEVELAVTLRFGSRRLLLRQVLDLNPGVVVDLDRQVKDPVDMLLDGRLVARGEVVVMDGNYGLRITEVAPPVCS